MPNDLPAATARTTLPADKFPVRIEALHWLSRAVVWSKTIERPEPGTEAQAYIPPLFRTLGHPVALRMTFADGTVQESEPVLELPSGSGVRNGTKLTGPMRH